MTMRLFTSRNVVFVAALLGVFLVVFGLVSREWIYVPAALIVGYLLVARWEAGLLLFVRFIPFFFALPITASFDNFNVWRIAVLVLFTKWLVAEWGSTVAPLLRRVRTLLVVSGIEPRGAGSERFWSALDASWKRERLLWLGLVLAVLALVSLTVAQDLEAGLRRIIYFGNMVPLLVMIRYALKRERAFFGSLTVNFFISGAAAVGVGFLQWIVTYFVPASAFYYWWSQIISLNMYGSRWANIVTAVGNTWFNYSGGGLRLRMFSLFPDSHSFPLYVVFVLPFLFVLLAGAKQGRRLERGLGWGAFVAFHLALVLTGTRGIWAGVLFPLAAAGTLWWRAPELRGFLKTVLRSAGVFLALFPLAWGIVALPQFPGETVRPRSDIFFSRLVSLIDAGETSNSGRLAIWMSTLVSIKEKPLLGVGIGNFPVVLDQDVALAKAGSSAHNLFLHIPAEMGLAALVVSLWLMLAFFSRMLAGAKAATAPPWHRLFLTAAFWALVWVFGYSLTDPALFDERAFLGFMVLTGTILGLTSSNSNNQPGSP